MSVRRFPSVFGNDFEMLRAIRVALDPHKHFGALLKFGVFENISPHSGVALYGGLALEVKSSHAGHDLVSSWQRRGIVRRTGRRSGKQEQSSQQQVRFHL